MCIRDRLCGFLFLSFIVYPKGMGFGDVKLAIPLGLYVGWLVPDIPRAIIASLWVLLIAASLGGVIGVLLKYVFKRVKAEIPFGPFLVLGTMLAIMAA